MKGFLENRQKWRNSGRLCHISRPAHRHLFCSEQPNLKSHFYRDVFSTLGSFGFEDERDNSEVAFVDRELARCLSRSKIRPEGSEDNLGCDGTILITCRLLIILQNHQIGKERREH